MKLITRFAVLRLGILFSALGIGVAIYWNETHPDPFNFSDETMATYKRIEGMLPEPLDAITVKGADLMNLLVELDNSFFTEDGEVASWLNYDHNECTYSLIREVGPEDLPSNFHQAVANLLEWHERERDPVPIFSSQVDHYSYAFQPGVLSPANLSLMISILPPEQADEISAAFAHAAYFFWTSATGLWDVLLAKNIWEALDGLYPEEEERNQIRGEWKPDAHPQALRLASIVLYDFQFATTISEEHLVISCEVTSGEKMDEKKIEERYAFKLSATEQILLGFKRGASKEEIDMFFQALVDHEPFGWGVSIYGLPLWLSD